MQTFRKRRAGLSATAGLSCLGQPCRQRTAERTPAELQTVGQYIASVFIRNTSTRQPWLTEAVERSVQTLCDPGFACMTLYAVFQIREQVAG